MRKAYFLLILSLLSCSVSNNTINTRTIKFSSAFGNFTMQAPREWTWTDIPGEPSFDGKIAMSDGDTLQFSLGFWSSLLKGDKLTSWEDLDEYIQAKKYKSKIDGYDAYVITPADSSRHICRLYIDSLYGNGQAITKFDIFGKHLSEANNKLFFQTVETIKFER